MLTGILAVRVIIVLNVGVFGFLEDKVRSTLKTGGVRLNRRDAMRIEIWEHGLSEGHNREDEYAALRERLGKMGLLFVLDLCQEVVRTEEKDLVVFDLRVA